MATIRKKLGELLMEAGLIDEMQLKTALAHQKEWGGRLGAILIQKGFVKETAMMSVIGDQLGMSCMPLEKFEKPSEEVMRLVKEEIARRFGILPQKFDGKTLIAATSDPTDLKMLDDLGFLLNVRVKPLLALESDIHTALDHFYDPMTSSSTLAKKAHAPDMSFTPEGAQYELMSDVTLQERDHDKKGLSTGDIDHAVIAGIVDLLVEKGIFTRDELAERINFRKG
jgi:type IV pilus assembly protein PilB